MKRPAFQFYTKDWQTNLKLRRCSPAARGVWIDVLCLMHQSDEYGVLRWSLKEIANTAGASLAHVRELADKGVLKGGDQGCEPYIFTPRHAGKVGDPVVLIEATRTACWYSSRFVRDEYVRGRRGEGTRFDTDHQPESRSPKVRVGDELGDGPPVSNLQFTNPLQEPSVPSEGGTAKPRAARKCPKWFEVDEKLRAWAADGFSAVDLALETDKFRDHTFGHAITDWPGAWRNWIRKAAEFRPRGAAPLNRQEALEKRNRTVADEWAQGDQNATH
jgi:hypothetical protein